MPIGAPPQQVVGARLLFIEPQEAQASAADAHRWQENKEAAAAVAATGNVAKGLNLHLQTTISSLNIPALKPLPFSSRWGERSP